MTAPPASTCVESSSRARWLPSAGLASLVGVCIFLAACGDSVATEPSRSSAIHLHSSVDLGSIFSDSGSVAFSILGENRGSDVLVLRAISRTCGCVAPVRPRTRVEPGTGFELKMRFKPKSRRGAVRYAVDVRALPALNLLKRVWVTANIVPNLTLSPSSARLSGPSGPHAKQSIRLQSGRNQVLRVLDVTGVPSGVTWTAVATAAGAVMLEVSIKRELFDQHEHFTAHIAVRVGASTVYRLVPFHLAPRLRGMWLPGGGVRLGWTAGRAFTRRLFVRLPRRNLGIGTFTASLRRAPKGAWVKLVAVRNRLLELELHVPRIRRTPEEVEAELSVSSLLLDGELRCPVSGHFLSEDS